MKNQTRTLIVTHADGSIENVPVFCGTSMGARRIPARIGRAMVAGTASAVLDYDGKPRRAIFRGRYFIRTVQA